jgi:hypothetical protein
MSLNHFNFQLLQKVVERDQCSIDASNYKDIASRDIKVSFTCVCGENDTKPFRRMFETGAFCKKCMDQRAWDKLRQTNQERYGVDKPFQSKEIRDKAKKTHLERHGCEFPLQTNAAKEKAKQTFQDKYNVSNPMQCKAVQDKAKQTNMERYGVEHNLQRESVKAKIKETLLDRYGVENPMMHNDVKDKCKITNLQRYGFESHNTSDDVQVKKKNTLLTKYGVENPMHSEEVKERLKQSCLEKYGVENPMQVPEINDKACKNAFRYKEYMFPCGEVRLVQGYEPFALDALIKDGHNVDNIVTDKSKVPEIWYEHNNSKRRYFPDIYLLNTNTIIEVKSMWTFEREKDKNLLKAEACKAATFNFEFWIFDVNGNRVEHDTT